MEMGYREFPMMCNLAEGLKASCENMEYLLFHFVFPERGLHGRSTFLFSPPLVLLPVIDSY